MYFIINKEKLSELFARDSNEILAF